MLSPADFKIPTLGLNEIPSPLKLVSSTSGDGLGDFVSGSSRVRMQLDTSPDAPDQDIDLERAGPREKVYFDPYFTTAAVVTCGGLCPGLNNVVRSIYLELTHNYGVRRVLGIRNGYLGLNPAERLDPVELTEDRVSHIHDVGGTILGSSRGPQDPKVVVDFLQRSHIDVLFCVGGDGTQRGAHGIYEEVTRRGLSIAIVGIPKTIDNDIKYVFRTFGFATALETAQNALSCAHVEAKGAPAGIGLVKLMGRDAGFIAAWATLASQEVNFCLAPEVDFCLDGPMGLLPALKQRMVDRRHAVIAVAEGAGQTLCGAAGGSDASGNRGYGDIGTFLKERITTYFREEGMDVSLKYIDPSYLIRSVPANTADRLLSDQMARYGVHAAMAGNTDVLIGMVNNMFVHIPICTAIAEKKRMEVTGDLWTNVLLATGQPPWPASAPPTSC
ncbi:MAG: ATP-dependent 6-phosphofructokinase [Planctomycetales bacterium]|nr:ATP-dependent 6-phosphofructokinase [Planctomycetales bacterium]